MTIYYKDNHVKGNLAEEYIKNKLKNKNNKVFIYEKGQDRHGRDIEEYDNTTKMITYYQVKSTTTHDIKINVNNCDVNYIAIVELINNVTIDKKNIYIIPINSFINMSKIYSSYNKKTDKTDCRYCMNTIKSKKKLEYYRK